MLIFRLKNRMDELRLRRKCTAELTRAPPQLARSSLPRHRQSSYYHYSPSTYTTFPPTPLSCIFSPSPFTYTTFPPTLLHFPTTPFTHITFPPSPLSYTTSPPQGNSPPKKSIRQTSFAPLRFFRKEFSSFNTSSISPRNSPTQNPIHP